MAVFPAPWTVQVSRWTLGEPDKYGEREKVFGPPEDRKVYGWAPPGVEDEIFSANRDAVVQDLDVYVPPSFEISPDDLMFIDGDEFRVLGGLRDFNHGPFRFSPGRAVRVKRVKELG